MANEPVSPFQQALVWVALVVTLLWICVSLSLLTHGHPWLGVSLLCGGFFITMMGLPIYYSIKEAIKMRKLRKNDPDRFKLLYGTC